MKKVLLCLTILLSLPTALIAQEEHVAAVENARWISGRICDPHGDESAELAASPYHSVGPLEATAVYYVLSTPWCPSCKKVYDYARSDANREIEFRFLLHSPRSAPNLLNMAQLVSSDKDEIDYVYGDKVADEEAYSLDQQIELASVSMMSAEIALLRSRTMIEFYNKKYNRSLSVNATPIISKVFDFGAGPDAISSRPGAPDLDTSGGDLKNPNNLPPVLVYKSDEIISFSPGASSQMISLSNSGDARMPVYAYPNKSAVSLCHDTDQHYELLAIAELDGVKWGRIEYTKYRPQRGSAAIPMYGYIPMQ